MKRATVLVLAPICSSFGLLAVACSETEPISEETLLEYAKSPLDRMVWRMVLEEGPYVIGTLDGADITVNFICSDVCPNNARRVISIDVPDGNTCGQMGGVERLIPVPIGIGMGERTFCFPQAIIDNWEAYSNPAGSVPLISPADIPTMRLRGACKGREGQTIEMSSGQATCPANLPFYMSFADLTLLPKRADAVLISVVGFLGSSEGRPALYSSAESAEIEDQDALVLLRRAADMSIVDACMDGMVRVTGVFRATSPPVVEVEEIRTGRTAVCFDSTEQ